MPVRQTKINPKTTDNFMKLRKLYSVRAKFKRKLFRRQYAQFFHHITRDVLRQTTPRSRFAGRHNYSAPTVVNPPDITMRDDGKMDITNFHVKVCRLFITHDV